MTTNTFGAWVQRRRNACDLTQRELAHQVGCAPMTMYQLEAGHRRPSKALAMRLAEALAVPPDARDAFLFWARTPHAAPLTLDPQAVPPHATVRPPFTCPPLPAALTSFIGRETELAAIGARLQREDVRLLTLTGPPGIGKTRLAIQVARHLRGAFPDGVAFVPLVTIRDPARLYPLIAQTLQIPERSTQSVAQTLVTTLQQHKVLLVLDNLEHLPTAHDPIAALLAQVPTLTLLVTSRTLVHLAGEHRYVVPPLAVPHGPDLPAADVLGSYAAIALLVQRAQALDQHFTVTAATAPHLVALCTQLDGIPLAIELAAAQLRFYSPAMLRRQVAQGLECLTHATVNRVPHHQTLTHAIAWSYDLLDPLTQHLLCRLGVFVGGCTLDAATAMLDLDDQEHVGGATDPPTLPLHTAQPYLAQLVDQHLLERTMEPDGELRFTLLETIRRFALAQLTAQGDLATMRQRHAAYYEQLVETATAQQIGPDQAVWFARIEADMSNIRAAWDWTITTQQPARALRLCVALSLFWRTRGSMREGRAWLAQALQVPYQGSADIRAQALRIAGVLAMIQDDYQQAEAYFAQGLALRPQVQDQQGIARTLAGQGRVAYWRGDYPRALVLLQEARDLLQACGDQDGAASVWLYLGVTQLNLGDSAQAHQALAHGLVLYRTLHHPNGIGMALNFLGRAALYQGAAARAATFLAESQTILQQVGNRQGLARTWVYQGRVALRSGDPAQALTCLTAALDDLEAIGDHEGLVLLYEGGAGVARAYRQWVRAGHLLGLATTVRQRLEMPPPPADRAFYAHLETTIQMHVRADHVPQVWPDSLDLLLDAARQALTELVHACAVPTTTGLARLTPREWEVLRLVTHGLRNGAIAQQLVISPRTVQAHLSNIYAKLGVTSRSAAMRLALAQQWF